jgi:hypothetical protein
MEISRTPNTYTVTLMTALAVIVLVVAGAVVTIWLQDSYTTTANVANTSPKGDSSQGNGPLTSTYNPQSRGINPQTGTVDPQPQTVNPQAGAPGGVAVQRG